MSPTRLRHVSHLLHHLFLGLALQAVVQVAAASATDKEGCEGGACPYQFDDSSSSDTNKGNDNQKKCGMWMGPSHIKKAEEQGFGMGIFTGKPIAKGTPLEPIYNHGPVGEPLIPLYGHETLYVDEPPLREYIWDEGPCDEFKLCRVR